MSYASDFEIKAGKSMAMTTLNSLRKLLASDNYPRKLSSFEKQETEALVNAATFLREKRAGQFSSDMVIASTRNLGGTMRSATMPIYESLKKALSYYTEGNEKEYDNLLDMIIGMQSESATIDKEKVHEIVTLSMDFASRERSN